MNRRSIITIPKQQYPVELIPYLLKDKVKEKATEFKTESHSRKYKIISLAPLGTKMLCDP
jgi:hypothetical protein